MSSSGQRCVWYEDRDSSKQAGDEVLICDEMMGSRNPWTSDKQQSGLRATDLVVV